MEMVFSQYYYNDLTLSKITALEIFIKFIFPWIK